MVKRKRIESRKARQEDMVEKKNQRTGEITKENLMDEQLKGGGTLK